jgi:arabinofuranan 3-O-arabinosyltransferase
LSRPTRDHIFALGFAAVSFALAFLQRPGWATSDTKVDLHVDPGGFLADVASVWAPSIDLGAVQGAQYSGYLWPMGPVFALLDGIGLTPWVAERVWLGLLFAASAWGMLKLLDELVGTPRAVPHLLGTGFYLLNPYTVIFSARTSVVLLGYAALPWLLLFVHRGVHAVRGWRDWHGWWWAAAFALVLTSTGGGVNAAVVGWMLVGPLALLAYEPLAGGVRWRDAGAFLARVAVLGGVVSIWWIVPLLVHVRYGVDFLQFTEQPRAIWGTNSAPEAVRLMAYWTSYIGVGFYGARHALYSEAGTLLFNPLAVGASLLLPALACVGFALARRRRYAPFFLLLLLVGAAIEVAGFPDGTPAREGMEWVYRNVSVLRFLRTTQKAAPLVAVGIGGLLALLVQVGLARLREGPPGWPRRAGPAILAGGLTVLVLLSALPLMRGDGVEGQLAWKQVPSAWERAGSDLDRELPRNSRALVLPGQIFAYYLWGGTIDAILPRLTDRPVAVRFETPYSDPHATDLLWTVDRLVQQRRLMPDQLTPLLSLMGAGAVVTGADDDISRSGGMNAASAAEELATQGLGAPDRRYGPRLRVAPPPRDPGPVVELPRVRRYDLPPGRGLVSVAPRARPTVVDGSAEGLAGLAAFGALPAHAPILYAGDLDSRELGQIAARGAEVVVSDSNRRRRFVPEYGHQNLGATLRQDESVNANFALIEPFPERGADAQTISVLSGARYVRSPNEGGLLEFPEYDAIKAFDGDPSTVWAADRYLDPSERWIEIGFTTPRDVPYVDLYPVHDWSGIVREVEVGGVRAKLHRGRNRIRLGLDDASSLRLTITRVDQPPGDLRGAGGFREIRIPGVSVRAALRPPVLAARALAGRDLSRVGLTYLLERTTADTPFRRDRQTGSPLLELASNRRDPEARLDRLLFAPEARTYQADAWVYPAVDARDWELDRLAGVRAPLSFDSSGRFHNEPRYRASSAFDTSPGTAWVGIWARPSAPFPWIAWTGRQPLELSRLKIVPGPGRVRRPSVVRLSWPGGRTGALRVGDDGRVELGRRVRARGFRMTILETSPGGGSHGRHPTRAVAIGSLRAPGVVPVRVPRGPGAAPLRTRCGDARLLVNGRELPLRPDGTRADLQAGRPMLARGCPGRVRMGGGVQRVSAQPATFAVDLLRLRSPAPEPVGPAASAGRVVEPGELHGSSLDGVRLELDRPAWLVLGQSFSDGWRATCDGRDLGEPRPVNAYANGWRAPRDCERVEFAYAPQDAVRAGYAISAIAAALLLAFLVAAPLAARRRGEALPPPAGAPPDPAALLPDDKPARLTLPRAALIALAVTVPLALLFALRSSVAIFPLLTLVLWRGVGSRPLAVAGAALIGVAVPLLYLIVSPRDRGGFNFEYSTELISAHWVGVIALVLLMAACWRSLAAVRRRT